ncbi:MAG TPA: hypothetical protein PLB81_11430, partial [Deltaproteobacteria bacterium]|nr:hypothetical protein [Deltaproteobacteria bacterium]
MAVNMIGMLKGLLTDNLIARTAELLGENKSGVTNAVGGALPTLLLGLALDLWTKHAVFAWLRD